MENIVLVFDDRVSIKIAVLPKNKVAHYPLKEMHNREVQDEPDDDIANKIIKLWKEFGLEPTDEDSGPQPHNPATLNGYLLNVKSPSKHSCSKTHELKTWTNANRFKRFSWLQNGISKPRATVSTPLKKLANSTLPLTMQSMRLLKRKN